MINQHENKVNGLVQHQEGLKIFFNEYMNELPNHSYANLSTIREKLKASLNHLNETNQCNKNLVTALNDLEYSLAVFIKKRMAVPGALFYPAQTTLSGTVTTAVLKSVGVTGLASVGAMAAAGAVGGAVLIPAIALAYYYLPPDVGPGGQLNWLAILLKYIVQTGLAIAALAIGAAIMGTSLNPILLLSLFIAASAAYFVMTFGFMLLTSGSDPLQLRAIIAKAMVKQAPKLGIEVSPEASKIAHSDDPMKVEWERTVYEALLKLDDDTLNQWEREFNAKLETVHL